MVGLDAPCLCWLAVPIQSQLRKHIRQLDLQLLNRPVVADDKVRFLRLFVLGQLAGRALLYQLVPPRGGTSGADFLVGDDDEGLVEHRFHPRLEQQRHLDDGGRALLHRLAEVRNPLADAWPEDAFEPLALLVVAEHLRRDGRPVDPAIRRDPRAELLHQQVPDLIRREQLVRHGVGRQGRGAQALERAECLRLAGSDASREADEWGPRHLSAVRYDCSESSGAASGWTSAAASPTSSACSASTGAASSADSVGTGVSGSEAAGASAAGAASASAAGASSAGASAGVSAGSAAGASAAGASVAGASAAAVSAGASAAGTSSAGASAGVSAGASAARGSAVGASANAARCSGVPNASAAAARPAACSSTAASWPAKTSSDRP